MKDILSDPFNSTRTIQFMLVVKRLKEEYASLEAKVTDLNRKAEQVHNRDILFTLNLLQLLPTDVQILMQELDAHEEWEEKEVFPIASEYFKLQIRPSITPSIWVLEKEHGIDNLFFYSKSFRRKSNEHRIQTIIQQSVFIKQRG
jgi:iron-sulfur cluster repair protein YtfE (RIC family)